MLIEDAKRTGSVGGGNEIFRETVFVTQSLKKKIGACMAYRGLDGVTGLVGSNS